MNIHLSQDSTGKYSVNFGLIVSNNQEPLYVLTSIIDWLRLNCSDDWTIRWDRIIFADKSDAILFMAVSNELVH